MKHVFFVFWVLVVLVAAMPTAAERPNPALPVFERVFGDAVKLDPAIVAKVRDGKPGERHYVDKNGDGVPEEVWFIDTAKRHPESMQPVLVRVINGHGNLRVGEEPELNDNLFVVDWNADGVVDAVCEYKDTDGDGGADEVAFYSAGGGAVPNDALFVWWGRNIGKDHLLWYDAGYVYSQPQCQSRSHFGGNEIFCAFTLKLDDPEWVPIFENPFCFYDLDGDGVSEETIRIGGRGNTIENLRYSFDAAHVATPDDPRHYDVSISAYAPENFQLDPGQAERTTLHGIPTGPFLSYRICPDFARETRWATTLLTWCENGINIDGTHLDAGKFHDTQERWEGIIACGNPWFKQIGGPTCGPFNKRYELASSPKTMRLYFSPTDQRLHLFGADRMWLDVDLGYANVRDRTPDMHYEYRDTDGDGYIDTWTFDANGDGQPDDTWTAGSAPRIDIPYTWAEVNRVFAPVLASVPEMLFLLDTEIMQALEKLDVKEPDRVWNLLQSGFDVPNLDEDLRVRLLSSREALRFYLDLLKDRLIVTMKAKYQDAEFWKRFNELRGNGDLGGMARQLETTFTLSPGKPSLTAWLGEITARFAKPRVAWAQDWVPPNIGWESEECAYRVYWGQFDMFGKKKKCLVMSTFGNGGSYHEEQDWGMDTLEVGDTCGLGGVTLYINDKPYPVWSPGGKGPIAWSKKLVSETPDKVTVELTATFAWTVRFRCSALAGRKDSPIEVSVEGGDPGDNLQLGIGIRKLPQEKFVLDTNAGIMANWGIQETAIGPVGLGVIFSKAGYVRYADLPNEHQVVVRIEKDGPVVYHIQGTWMNGQRFARCPNIDNWVEDLKGTAITAALK